MKMRPKEKFVIEECYGMEEADGEREWLCDRYEIDAELAKEWGEHASCYRSDEAEREIRKDLKGTWRGPGMYTVGFSDSGVRPFLAWCDTCDDLGDMLADAYLQATETHLPYAE